MLDRVYQFLNKNKWVLPALAAVAILAVAVVFYDIMYYEPPIEEPPAFQPPAFEEMVIQGEPGEEAKRLGYSEIYQEGMEFKAGICAFLQIKEERAQVYFNNPKENQVWMKLRITNGEGEIVAESGLIKPGEYLQYISFEEVPALGEMVELKIMSYQPESYESAGAFKLDQKVLSIDGERAE